MSTTVTLLLTGMAEGASVRSVPFPGPPQNMGDIGEWSNDVAQLGAAAAVNVRGVYLGFVVLRGQPGCEQSQRGKRGNGTETDRAGNRWSQWVHRHPFHFLLARHMLRAQEASRRVNGRLCITDAMALLDPYSARR